MVSKKKKEKEKVLIVESKKEKFIEKMPKREKHQRFKSGKHNADDVQTSVQEKRSKVAVLLGERSQGTQNEVSEIVTE